MFLVGAVCILPLRKEKKFMAKKNKQLEYLRSEIDSMQNRHAPRYGEEPKPMIFAGPDFSSGEVGVLCFLDLKSGVRTLGEL
jgi:hypothetical protein